MVRGPFQNGHRKGFTLIEVLIVLAIIGVLSGIGFISGRRVLRGQQDRSAVNTLQQSVWQGATVAASRGIRTVLYRDANDLQVRAVNDDGTTGDVIRTFSLPDGVATNLPATESLVFTPPGKVEPSTLASLPDPLTLVANGTTYDVSISLIGEVKVVAR
jgi:prepilin-type N-terminal cleavage/methylation domain-containing protein